MIKNGKLTEVQREGFCSEKEHVKIKQLRKDRSYGKSKNIENQIIEYRSGNSKVFSTVKMPGIVKYGNVTMKRGVFVNDNTFWAWHAQISMNTIKRHTVLIKLLDENGGVHVRARACECVNV